MTDAQGVGTIVKYGSWDAGSAGGCFTVNGVTQSAQQEIGVNAGNLGTINYVGGSVAGSEALYVCAYYGIVWSSWGVLTASTTAVNTAPIATMNDHRVAIGQQARTGCLNPTQRIRLRSSISSLTTGLGIIAATSQTPKARTTPPPPLSR
ncbi:MAG: hypothetical protein Q8M24_09885 [Pseudolabrys sp.]|nr:hypothetical protein [Pseudolabrys sp.]MDP2295757.1 hypothetical protein [Pseudolabrys sp.]